MPPIPIMPTETLASYPISAPMMSAPVTLPMITKSSWPIDAPFVEIPSAYINFLAVNPMI